MDSLQERDFARIVPVKEAPKCLFSTISREKAEILKEALLQTKDKFYQEKAEFEKRRWGKRQELLNLEKRFIQRESHLDKKIELLDTKEADIGRREKSFDAAGKNNSGTREEGGLPFSQKQRTQLENIAKMFRRGKAIVDGVHGERGEARSSRRGLKRSKRKQKELADKKSNRLSVWPFNVMLENMSLRRPFLWSILPNEEMRPHHWL